MDIDRNDDIRLGRLRHPQLALASGIRGEVYLRLPHFRDRRQRCVSFPCANAVEGS
jgi:hypothetical protein